MTPRGRLVLCSRLHRMPHWLALVSSKRVGQSCGTTCIDRIGVMTSDSGIYFFYTIVSFQLRDRSCGHLWRTPYLLKTFPLCIVCPWQCIHPFSLPSEKGSHPSRERCPSTSPQLSSLPAPILLGLFFSILLATVSTTSSLCRSSSFLKLSRRVTFNHLMHRPY